MKKILFHSFERCFLCPFSSFLLPNCKRVLNLSTNCIILLTNSFIRMDFLLVKFCPQNEYIIRVRRWVRMRWRQRRWNDRGPKKSVRQRLLFIISETRITGWMVRAGVMLARRRRETETQGVIGRARLSSLNNKKKKKVKKRKIRNDPAGHARQQRYINNGSNKAARKKNKRW